MKTRFIKFLVLLVVFQTNAFSLEKALSRVEKVKKRDLFFEIKSLKPSDYIYKIDLLRVEIEKFISIKKRVCMGEFSTFVLTGLNVKENKLFGNSEQLSKDEQKVCMRDIVGLKIELIENLYIARKNFFDYLYNKRAKELLEIKNKAIKKLKVLKYNSI